MNRSSPYKLHNQAVLCIQKEEYGEAVTLLQKAMKKVRLAISGDLRPGLFLPELTEPTDDEGECFCRFVSGTSCFLKIASSPSSRSGEGSSSRHSIYSSPILLTRGVDLLDPSSCEQFSYVAVYNLALTYHLMAIKSRNIPKRSARKLLQRSLSLYENAHNVLMSSPDIDVSILHSLALWSNLGHILDALGEDEKSELCYQHLLSTIFYVVDREREGTDKGTNDDSIPIDGFFSNVMNLLKNESVAPAA